MKTTILKAAALFMLASGGASGCVSDPLAQRLSGAITSAIDDDGDPAVVALTFNGQVVCTGAIIAPRTVLTAAHCVVAGTPQSVFVGASPERGGTLVEVVDAVAHPEFQFYGLKNDIAVLRLRDIAPVAPVALFTEAFDDSFIGMPLLAYRVRQGRPRRR